jgi:hypothetical protein
MLRKTDTKSLSRSGTNDVELNVFPDVVVPETYKTEAALAGMKPYEATLTSGTVKVLFDAIFHIAAHLRRREVQDLFSTVEHHRRHAGAGCIESLPSGDANSRPGISCLRYTVARTAYASRPGAAEPRRPGLEISGVQGRSQKLLRRGLPTHHAILNTKSGAN